MSAVRTVDQWGALYLTVSGFLLIGMRQNLTVPLSLGLSIGQFLFFGAGLLWVLTRLRGERFAIRNRTFTVVVGLYLVAILLSYSGAVSRGLPASAVEYSNRYLLISVALVLAVFATMTLITTVDGLLLVMKGLLVGGTVSAGFALLQSLTGLDLAGMFRLPGLRVSDFALVNNLMREGLVRPQGSAGHPLELAVVLTALVPIGVGVTGSSRARNDRVWPWVLCTGIVTFGALSTVSRSIVLGLGVALAVMAWRWPVRRLAVTFAGLGVAVGVGWVLQINIAKALASSFTSFSNDPSLASRSSGWDFVFANYRDHLWFGEGVGTYPALPSQPVLDNEYLSRLIEGGVISLAIYIVLLVTTIVLAIRASAAKDLATAEIGSGLSGALAVIAATGAVLDIGGFIQVLTLAWLLFALSVVAEHVAHNDPQMPANVGSGGNQCGGPPELAL